MKNKLQTILDKEYLTTDDLIKCLHISPKTVFNWIKGVRVQVGGKNHKFSKPIRLKPTRLDSPVFHKDDVIKFLKETNKESKILDIPSYMRSK